MGVDRDQRFNRTLVHKVQIDMKESSITPTQKHSKPSTIAHPMQTPLGLRSIPNNNTPPYRSHGDRVPRIETHGQSSEYQGRDKQHLPDGHGQGAQKGN